MIRPSEGYSILSGFGNDEVLHHLPLEGQCLGKKKEKSKIILKKILRIMQMNVKHCVLWHYNQIAREWK